MNYVLVLLLFLTSHADGARNSLLRVPVSKHLSPGSSGLTGAIFYADNQMYAFQECLSLT